MNNMTINKMLSFLPFVCPYSNPSNKGSIANVVSAHSVAQSKSPEYCNWQDNMPISVDRGHRSVARRAIRKLFKKSEYNGYSRPSWSVVGQLWALPWYQAKRAELSSGKCRVHARDLPSDLRRADLEQGRVDHRGQSKHVMKL